MKKKMLAAALVLLVVLTGCGQSEDSAREPEKLRETQAADAGEADADEASGADKTQSDADGADAAEDIPEGSENPEPGAPEGDSEPAEAIYPACPGITVNTCREVRYEAEDGQITDRETDGALLAEVCLDRVELTGEGFEAAAEVFRRKFADTQQEATALADELAEESADYFSYFREIGEDPFAGGCNSETRYEVSRLDARIVSLKESFYEYHAGAAHGFYGYGGFTVDAVTGEVLELTALMEDVPGFVSWMEEALPARIEAAASDEDLLWAEYANVISDYAAERFDTVSWYLDGEGVAVVFNPYELAAYAAGVIEVKCTYEELSPFLKPEYCGLQRSGVLSVPAAQEIRIPGKAGEIRRLLVETDFDDWDGDRYRILLDGEEQQVEENYGYVRRAALLYAPDGEIYLVFSYDLASDDYMTQLYRMTENGFEACGEPVGGAIFSGRKFSTESVELEVTWYVLGTYRTPMTAAVTKNGLVAQGDRYEVSSRSEWSRLRVKKELPVTIDGQKTTLPVGTSLWITAICGDGETVCFVTEEGSLEGEIHYVLPEDDYQHYIDGVSEYEYFEELPYVG